MYNDIEERYKKINFDYFFIIRVSFMLFWKYLKVVNCF